MATQRGGSKSDGKAGRGGNPDPVPGRVDEDAVEPADGESAEAPEELSIYRQSTARPIAAPTDTSDVVALRRMLAARIADVDKLTAQVLRRGDVISTIHGMLIEGRSTPDILSYIERASA